MPSPDNYPSRDNYLELTTAIDIATFVGYVSASHNESIRTEVSLSIKEVIKGYAWSLRTDNIPILPLDNRICLVVVNEFEGEISQFLYPVTPIDQLSAADLKILSELPCYSKELEDRNRNGACTREYFPVCGCNNKTFGNACEANHEGIIRYKIGKCE